MNKNLVPINVKEAIDFIGDAWNSINQLTIKRCWKHVGILPTNVLCQVNLDGVSNVDTFDDLSSLLDELNQLDNEMDMNCEDNLNVDSSCETFEVPKEDNIIREVLVENDIEPSSSNQNEDEEDDEIDIPLVPKAAAIEGLRKYISYLEHLDGIDYEDIKKIKEVNSKADLLEISKLKQQKILDFFSKSKN